MTDEGVHVAWPDGPYDHHVVTPSGNRDNPEATETRDQLSGDDEIIPWGTPNELRAVVIDPNSRDDVTTALMQIDTETSPPRAEGGVVPAVQTVESDAGVSLGWWTPQGRQLTWDISRDGDQIATTTKGSYIDRDAPTTMNHEYKITAQNPAAPEGEPKTYNYSAVVYTQDRNRVQVPARSTNPAGDVDIQPKSINQSATAEWRAFIPYRYVPKPARECVNTTPGGA